MSVLQILQSNRVVGRSQQRSVSSASSYCMRITGIAVALQS